MEEYRQRHARIQYLTRRFNKLLEWDPTKRAGYRIAGYIRRRIFPIPINISEEQLKSIPGIFRYRLYFNESNLTKPLIPKIKKTHAPVCYNEASYEHGTHKRHRRYIQQNLSSYAKDNAFTNEGYAEGYDISNNNTSNDNTTNENTWKNENISFEDQIKKVMENSLKEVNGNNGTDTNDFLDNNMKIEDCDPELHGAILKSLYKNLTKEKNNIGKDVDDVDDVDDVADVADVDDVADVADVEASINPIDTHNPASNTNEEEPHINMDSELEQVLKKSLLDLEGNEKNELDKTIQESMKDVNVIDETDLTKVINSSLHENDELDDVEKAIQASLHDMLSSDKPEVDPKLSDDESNLNAAIAASMAEFTPDVSDVNLVKHKNSSPILDDEIEGDFVDDIHENEPLPSQDSSNQSKAKNEENNEKFCACLDLRIYGPNPTQPVYIFGKEYYLNNFQLGKVKAMWATVNPDTAAGIRYEQDRDYDKSVYDHMKNENLFTQF